MVGRMVVLCKVLRVLAVALGPEITNWLTWGTRVERRRRRDSRGRQDRCGRWCRCRCWCRCGRWGRCWGWCWCRWWCRCWCLGAKEARERLLTRLRLGGRRHSRAFLDWREEFTANVYSSTPKFTQIPLYWGGRLSTFQTHWHQVLLRPRRPEIAVSWFGNCLGQKCRSFLLTC